MRKNVLVLCIFLMFLGSIIWAGGSKDNESRSSDDLSGFTDSFDINNKKTGKWNYYIEATDRAGNVTRAGPDNMYIDPESDLPITTIVNPIPNMRIQGNVNIVGIAVDDDGVDHVMLKITRGRDGRGEELLEVRAQGSDYWSYFLDTTNQEIWTDGVYTITAWAIDINGLSGISEDFKARQHKFHQVYFNLDRKKPAITVDSHEIGALVAGRVRLRGTVYDGNGVNNLNYSINEGISYSPVKISQDRRAPGSYTWDLEINTKNIFEDGPAVIWFQGEDGQGSVGTSAHLLFVNNTGPDVKIVYPEPSAVVNGIFSVAGYASHPVGLKSVTWKAGRQAGEIELLPGNHWWSFDLDTRGSRDSSIDIEIRAEDVSGNVTVAKQRYRVNQNADIPTVAIAETFVDPELGIVVKGIASDDDGVASIFYSLNSGAAVEIPCSGYFQFLIPSPPEGTYTVDVWAKDITGVTGNKVQVKNISVLGALPQPGIEKFTSGSGNTAVVQQFYTGMTVKLQPKVRTTMDITVRAPALSSATVAFGEGSPSVIRPGAAGRDGLMRVQVQVPANLPSGFTKIELKAVDRAGREVIYNEYVIIEQTDTAVFSSYDPFNRWFSFVRTNELPDGRILLGADDVLLGIPNQPVSTAIISGSGSNNIQVSVDEYGRVSLKALNEGSFGPFTLNLGGFSSRQFSILADFSGPSLTLPQTPPAWVQNNVPVTVNVASVNRVRSLDYSLDMGVTWRNLLTAAEAAAIAGSNSFTRAVNVTDLEDGGVCILIRAVNEAGNVSVIDFSTQKDTQAPVAQVVMPIADARVNGTIRAAFAIQEAGALRSVTYNRPATAAGAAAITRTVFNADRWEGDYPPRFIEVLLDSTLMPLDANMRFTFEDFAGNRSEVNSWDFVIDQEMDIPIVHIILPLENEVITSDFIVSGVMFDDDGIKNVSYRIDSGREQIIEAQNGFSIFIPISSMTDNEHTITVVAEDIYGVKSAPVVRNFRVSLSEPAAALTYPLYDTVLRDYVELRGTSSDANGIDEVYISVDNGNTFNKATGTTQWSYRFNTRILNDGAHVVFMRVIDRYGISATYANMLNVDNTPPEIVMDSPDDGSISVGTISVMGRAFDPNMESVTISLRSLTGANIRQDLRTRELGAASIIRETLDLAGQPDGLYNVEVSGTDRAGNFTRISRNFELARQSTANFVEILYPLNNEQMSGEFYLYGYTGGIVPAEVVTLRINGTDIMTADVDTAGYFRFSLNGEHFQSESNSVIAYSNFGGGAQVSSRTHSLVYKQGGPWVTIDSFSFGEFAYNRPYLYGRNGYILTEEDQLLLSDRSTDRKIRAAIQNKTPDYTEISFDNGKTYTRTSKSSSRKMNYRFRLETGEMTEGIHYILVRTIMKNGEVAVTRMIVQVDKTPPVIRLISPEAGGRYNQELAYSASASDDIELTALTYHLRKGDKAFYELPGFLQGLYIDVTIPPFLKQIFPSLPNIFAGGTSYMDFGLGLSFFDDNVKIQVQYGSMTQAHYESLGGEGPIRYGGQILGIKLLANIYRLPFGPIAGPDWEWLSASFSIGANFSYMNFLNEMNPSYPDTGYTQSGNPTWMTALVAQIEFPKVTLPNVKYFRTFSLYTEGQLWFVPTDVDAAALGIQTIIPHIILGVRLYIF